MKYYKKRIEDVLKRPRSLISKVNFRRYLTNVNEPAENISELRLPESKIRKHDKIDSARQRVGIRKLAKKLRLRSK